MVPVVCSPMQEEGQSSPSRSDPNPRRARNLRGPSEQSYRRAQLRRRRPTPIERMLGSILGELRLNFTREYWIAHFWVDFALTDYFVAIEADGRYFHGDPQREENRDDILRRRGWRPIHVFGPNIVNERNHVRELIKSEVRQARIRPRPPGSPPFKDVRLDWDRPILSSKPKGKLRKRRFRHKGEEYLLEVRSVG
jgi:very-short-patch-repair endonuclease